ncbi:MAG: enoyl-[acyl-carrier protein] reductase [Chloroflexota bacterium]|jgi:NAD(P)-dependent dehydrogenase (short-subunit alcohol dehydrogenase family)|nr:enoyl-[acyl-carrier protein] reductase [Chloroflexota bacterium]
MTDGAGRESWEGREPWAMVLGASSGFGGAAAKAWARAGFGIVGVHLDLRGTRAMADAVREEIAATGVPVTFHNVNAADEDRRHEVIEATKALFDERRAAGADPFIAGFLHSLAFGATLSYVTSEPDGKELSLKQLEMTVDVMAHSLVYWVRDLHHAGLIRDGSRLFAMTSEGASRAVPTYGAVSAAKAALEAHVRQLALELMPDGITVNAIRAGVTDTPALRRIPGHEDLIAVASARNPGGRMTRPDDVADALVALCSPLTYWMTGNTIGVDGGELMGSRSSSV